MRSRQVFLLQAYKNNDDSMEVTSIATIRILTTSAFEGQPYEKLSI